VRYSARRVATRFIERRDLMAGILEAPPAMVKDIHEWVQGVMAATSMEREKANLSGARESDKQSAASQRKFHEAVAAWEAAPTSWKAYVSAYDASWLVGHPGNRWSVRDFQKMTPEKLAVLDERSRVRIKHLRDQFKIFYGGSSETASVDRVKAKMDAIKPFLVSGVKPMVGNEMSKVFDIDTTGWRYGQKEMLDRMHKRVRSQAQDLLNRMQDAHKNRTEPLSDEILEMAKEYTDDLKKKIKTGDSGWRTIKVVLDGTGRRGKRFSGFWSHLPPELHIVLPENWDSGDLQRTIRHELQHFAQDYIKYMVDGTWSKLEMGFPSKSIRTPEYKQHYDPASRSFSKHKDEPNVRAIFRRLQQQGIDPRRLDWHSLDDVEFYTKLADDVEWFRDFLKGRDFDDKMTRAAVRWYVGGKISREEGEALGIANWGNIGSKFFKALKSRAPGKWRKAVGEFVKAVT